MINKIHSKGIRFCKILLIISITFILFIEKTSAFANNKLITVKVGFIESLNLSDSIASERFKSAYLSAIYYAVGESEKKLNKCGYKFQVVPSLTSNTNLISDIKAATDLENEGAWVILAPTRSDQYIMATKGLHSTAMISVMADSLTVEKMTPPYFTASPGVKELVMAATKAVRKENLGKTYGVFVDAACVECKDFEKGFENENDEILIKLFSLDGVSDTPSIENLLRQLAIKKVDFILLPNYSKFSGKVIYQVHQIYPNIKFLGADGWGQTVWSFLPGYRIPSGVVAISVRVGLSDDDMEKQYNVHSLDFPWQGKILKPPYLAYGTIDILRKLTFDLCTYKPNNKNEFIARLKQFKSNRYHTNAPISVYRLQDGILQFSYPIQTYN